MSILLKRFISSISLLGIAHAGLHAQSSFLQLEPVNFAQVNITDNFWKPKIDKVATKTLAACIYQTETATARIRNFEKVVRNKGEAHEGIFYDDSDVFKALEAMAYSLKTHPNPQMGKKCDEWIDKIAAAPVTRWLPEYLVYAKGIGSALDGYEHARRLQCRAYDRGRGGLF